MRPSHEPHRLLRTLTAVTALFAAGCYGDIGPYEDVQGLGAGGGQGGAGGGSAVARVYYRPQIQADLEAANCHTCHGGSAPMKVTLAPSSDAQWQANYNEVQKRAGTLADKAAGGGGHLKVTLAAEVTARWAAWVSQGAPYRAPPPDAGAGGGGGSGGGGGGGGSGGGAGGGGGDAGTPSDAGTAPMDAGTPLTWEADIRPLMASEGCTTCHGTTANYDLRTYGGAMGNGKDSQPNVVPGDPVSTLVIYCRSGHQGIDAAGALKVMRWVVDWEAQER
jgi:hypothetical protein